MAGTRAYGAAAVAAERAIVGLVAGHLDFEQGARGHTEFETAAAAVDQGARGNHETIFLLDSPDGLAGRAAGGPNVFDDQDALVRIQLEPAAQSHLSGPIVFDEKRTNAQGAGDFVADDDATESW